MHFDNPLGLSLMPYSHGTCWHAALQALSQCSLAAACHLALVTCSKHHAHLQEQNLLLSHGNPAWVVRDGSRKAVLCWQPIG